MGSPVKLSLLRRFRHPNFPWYWCDRADYPITLEELTIVTSLVMTHQLLEGSCVWEASPEVPGGLPCIAPPTRRHGLTLAPAPLAVLEADHCA